MNLPDYLVVAAVVASATVGAVRGFLREAVALAAWVIALFLAWHFADLIAPHLGGLMSDSGVRPWAARVIIVLLVLLLGAGVGAEQQHQPRSYGHRLDSQLPLLIHCGLVYEKATDRTDDGDGKRHRRRSTSTV